MNQLEQMARHIEQRPDDWDARLVYADLLDDHGEHVKANGQRWQAVNKRAPNNGGYVDGTAFWFVSRTPGCFDGLPYEILNRLDKPTIHGKHNSQQVAEDALAKRLHELGITAEVPA